MLTLIVPVHAESNLAAQPLASLGAEIKVLVAASVYPGQDALSLTLPSNRSRHRRMCEPRIVRCARKDLRGLRAELEI